jgi:peptidoglycan/LPS O-acetylase OafA/YrhL
MSARTWTQVDEHQTSPRRYGTNLVDIVALRSWAKTQVLSFTPAAGWHKALGNAFIHLLRRISRAVFPSFFVRTPEAPTPIRSTAYLDGLRGIAAFIVYTHHVVYTFTDDGFAYSDERADWYRLPFLRLLSAGSASVLVFFIVSSYSLSLKPVALMRQRKVDLVSFSLRSAAFRRAIRLYTPLIIASLLWLICINTGLFDATRIYWEDENLFTGYREHHPVAPRAFLSTEEYASGHWLRYIVHLCSTHVSYWWDDGVWSLYDEHAWTIPVEFFASMTLFITLMAVSSLKSVARVTVLTGLVLLALSQDWYELILFWTGPILVEVRLILDADGQTSLLPRSTASPSLQRKQEGSTAAVLMQVTGVILALYLLGTPEHDCLLPSSYYSTICSISPPGLRAPWRFWASVGAMLLLVLVSYSTHLSRLLSCRLCRYLGRISFALYLLHGLVNHLAGFAIFQAAFELVGRELDGVLYGAAWLLAFGLNTMAAIWAADIFTRIIDEPVVRLAKRTEVWLS